MKNREYRYLVMVEWNKKWEPCSYVDNVLYRPQIDRRNKRENVYAFSTKKQAQRAIRNTLDHIKEQEFPWPGIYRIDPITIN